MTDDGRPPASPEPPLSGFRSAALRGGARLSWVFVVVIAAQGVTVGAIDDPAFLGALAGLVGFVGLATAADWPRLLPTRWGPYLAWAWTALIVVATGSASAVPGMYGATVPLLTGIVVLTGLVLEPVRHAIVSLLAVAVVGIAAVRTGRVDSIEGLVVPVLSIGVAAAATAFLGFELERESARSAHRLAELTRQRVDFERLYAVSASLAGAESLSEGLPQIIGTICRYLTAQVGLVFLYEPTDHTLGAVSPMWVNGHTIDLDNLRLPISGGGIIPQVFRSGRTFHLEEITDRTDAFGIIGELGLSEALIAPLRVEGHPIGVVLVGDPSEGRFRPDQVEQLASLAAPAGLVLSYLGRYDAAAEMGRRMQEIAQMKTDFVSVVSHELRTPLTSIIGSLDTVVRPDLDPTMADDLISTARRQARRLQRLIDDLLMVSRLDRNAVPVALEPVSLRQLLAETAAAVPGLGALTTSLERDDIVAMADADHLGRVFINLFDNAAKYAPGSPVEVSVTVDGHTAAVAVADHGPGIPPEERATVFEQFTQLEHASTRTRGGTGLGLSIVKGLVEAMGGAVELTETPGGGSTFVVRLPLVRPAPLPAPETDSVPS